LSVGNALIVNLYLPCVGTADRMDIIEHIMCNVSVWIQKYKERIVIIGGDFNTDLDKHNPAADFLNNFAREHLLYTDALIYKHLERSDLHFNDT